MATKTITLTGAEIAVTGLDGANAHIRNDGTDVIYAAKAAGISAGADGDLGIPAGQAATVYGISGTVYMLGTGSAQIISNDYSELPFKTSATSGGSGADEFARAAINMHSGNAEIHVTAEEKAAWNDKAELTDIPTTLPANGGNADTVDGHHASDFALSESPSINGEINLTNWNVTHAVKIFAWEDTARIRNTDTSAEKLTYTDLIITPNGIYTEAIQDGAIISRTKINDNGNAAALESHPASDFVLKTDYDALAARVAALEGGTT